MVQPLVKLAVSEKINYRDTTQSSNSTCRCVAKRNENICPCKNLLVNVHKTFINIKEQKVETSTDEQYVILSIQWNIMIIKRNETLIHACYNTEL